MFYVILSGRLPCEDIPVEKREQHFLLEQRQLYFRDEGKELKKTVISLSWNGLVGMKQNGFICYQGWNPW